MPNLIQLKRDGYGEDSEIINLLIASSNLVEVMIIITDFFFLCITQKYLYTILIHCTYCSSGFYNFIYDYRLLFRSIIIVTLLL